MIGTSFCGFGAADLLVKVREFETCVCVRVCFFFFFSFLQGMRRVSSFRLIFWF